MSPSSETQSHQNRWLPRRPAVFLESSEETEAGAAGILGVSMEFQSFSCIDSALASLPTDTLPVEDRLSEKHSSAAQGQIKYSASENLALVRYRVRTQRKLVRSFVRLDA